MKEYKIVVLGNGGVGKSALTLQFVQGVFVTNYDATIEDSYRKLAQIDSENTRLEILDTAGTEQFSGMRETYYKSAQGFILVFSLAERSTYEDVKKLYFSIIQYRSQEAPIILVGNKSDLIGQREIDEQEATSFAKKMNIPYFETSAKLNQNVSQIFDECAVLILKLSIEKERYNKRRKGNFSEDSNFRSFLKPFCCFMC
ncbi:unnamed protein product [Caenorhabditis bovis]|uniref:Uncharacterized protein n=1 Tax=Caenorhabditis bovis TaxID=2654633 RepID=A0A8S1FBD7_9PELO|nr:unnamed protein product [Caenorhabditis bovis]